MAPPPVPSPVSPAAEKRSINAKVLFLCALLLLGAVLYNETSQWRAPMARRAGILREAALPLQKRPRKSRYASAADPDAPDEVLVSKTASPSTPRRLSTTAASSPPPPRTTTIAKPNANAPNFAARVDEEAAALTPSMEGLSCFAREHQDIAGDAAYVWGLSFNVASAAECCAACAAQQSICSQEGARGKVFWTASQREKTQARCSGNRQGRCNAWVFCPGSSDTPGAEDRCFSYTIHNHTKGECWLKHERNISVPIAAGPSLPSKMRSAPRKDWPWAVAANVWPWPVPEMIAWQAGILTSKAVTDVWRGTELPDWHHKFCRGKHGPC